jgi:hypothetical protein
MLFVVGPGVHTMLFVVGPGVHTPACTDVTQFKQLKCVCMYHANDAQT